MKISEMKNPAAALDVDYPSVTYFSRIFRFSDDGDCQHVEYIDLMNKLMDPKINMWPSNLWDSSKPYITKSIMRDGSLIVHVEYIEFDEDEKPQEDKVKY